MILYSKANFRSLRDSYLCTYIAPSREDVRNKLRQILRMTKFGDWLMFYLLAHNMDKASQDDIHPIYFGNFTNRLLSGQLHGTHRLGCQLPGIQGHDASQQCF